MPFSEELKKELADLIPKHGCCKKAQAFGILLDAICLADADKVAVDLPNLTVAESVQKLFSGVFGKLPEIEEVSIVGRKRYRLTQKSRTATAILAQWDCEEYDRAKFLLCESCTISFLRGSLIGCAVINDPTKEAHLEFRFKQPSRASILYPILSGFGMPPKIINRKSGYGLYYKRSGMIEDLLLQCGAQQAGFAFINEKIEKEIRNTENRVTNCDAKNIQKTVSASHKQISAIHRIMASPSLWERLPEELRVTARLRMEYENASLQELLHLHTPPISKSGLNHRLAKLMAIAEEETPRETKN